MQSTRFAARMAPSVFLITAVLSVFGCNTLQRETFVSDVTYRDQAAEIQKLVQFGSHRAATVRILEDAGIEGEYSSVGNSIYYCQLWKRKNGKRWAMNVALLFNMQDRFYAMQPTEAATSINHGPVTPPAEKKADGNASGPRNVIPFPPSNPPTEGPTARKPDLPSYRTGRRTPFGNSAN